MQVPQRFINGVMWLTCHKTQLETGGNPAAFPIPAMNHNLQSFLLYDLLCWKMHPFREQFQNPPQRGAKAPKKSVDLPHNLAVATQEIPHTRLGVCCTVWGNSQFSGVKPQAKQELGSGCRGQKHQNSFLPRKFPPSFLTPANWASSGLTRTFGSQGGGVGPPSPETEGARKTFGFVNGQRQTDNRPKLLVNP